MAEVDLEKMTATELRDYALKTHPEITGVHAMKKEDLVAAIHKARGEAAPEKGKKKRGAKIPVEKKQLKKQIRALRTEKQALQEGENKTALSRLRKKMKRLKRLTKKAA
jgi:hypothetical protein